jgi:pimeloyl-ACP methyl ester carboxylesterase
VPVIERDGVGLFYEEAGSGDPALLFVHGWTCDHSQFGPQVECFSPRHRTVVLDMRGHGYSEAIGPFDIPTYSEDVAWLSLSLGLDRPVVVGHSMGGMIAVELAGRHPELVRAVVALDSPFVAAGELKATVGPLLQALAGPEHLEARRQAAAMTVGPFASADLREQVVSTHCAPDRAVAEEAFASVVGWDGARILPQVQVPVLSISSSLGGPGGYTDASRFSAECSQLFTAGVVGAGHFIQLEVPDQVNAMIQRFLWIIGRQPGQE